MKGPPISHAIFVSKFSAMKDNSSVYFLLKPHILWTKIAHEIEIFLFLSGSVKIHKIPRVIFEITSQFFFKFCIVLQSHERFCNFLAETLYDFYKSNPRKCTISDF